MHRDPQQFERTIQFSRTERKVLFRRGGRYIRFGTPYCQSKISLFSIRFGAIRLMDGSQIFSPACPKRRSACASAASLSETGNCKDHAQTARAGKRLRRIAAPLLTNDGVKVHLYISNLTATLRRRLSHTLCPQSFHAPRGSNRGE
jgi:hypothetical protein